MLVIEHRDYRYKHKTVTLSTVVGNLDILIVGDDAVVHDDEAVGGLRALRMRVDLAGHTVRSPTCVRDADVASCRPIKVQRVLACGQRSYLKVWSLDILQSVQKYQRLYLINYIHKYNCCAIFYTMLELCTTVYVRFSTTYRATYGFSFHLSLLIFWRQQQQFLSDLEW